MRGGHDGQEEGGVRCGAVTTDRRRAGKGCPCDLWRCLASLGVTVSQLLGQVLGEHTVPGGLGILIISRVPAAQFPGCGCAT